MQITFKVAHGQTGYPWSRLVTVLDPVAKVARHSGYVDLGTLYVNLDSPQDLQIQGVSDLSYRFITGQPVKVNDKVGPYTITKVTNSLGVNLVYVS